MSYYSQSTLRPEKAVYAEMRTGVIKVTAVENDKTPRSLIILTGLKTLFQKQLPKMPREYIARLTFDTNSKALAIIKHGYKVVGGICYRPFPQRGFAEIVFFATASVDQVKGYGGMLMNHFKMHIRKTYPDMMHFLTYADNYAVGYFQKQGFSKQITLDRAVWAGYIKDYEGGTIMECHMLPKVDYLNTQELIAQQREAILTKIRQMSKSHVVHPGLPQFQEGMPEGITVDPQDVPGLRETGWTPDMQAEMSQLYYAKSPLYSAMSRILVELQNHSASWAFREPVNPEAVPDYYSVIKNPMDFSTMEHKLEHNLYPTMDSFVADAMLVFRNCRTYNQEGSVYYKNAMKLEKLLKEHVQKVEIE
ncbi:histone acetyltransferase GCN5 [Fomitiporia mediterranea MF3/22]|uniref:histone acetyltransferase GCN5 n=1 Tax=Fomitiporia mediterranea (strain MF3/22) TaxID=694068 RepID=UPI0004409C15|nr:histone acetyltransferase GCN5 [Fomitiporia mediterranea MF3/22]EJD02882.1 histone acetyltransferase GCN5 [Fomitiporia mediterranea MF3/22]